VSFALIKRFITFAMFKDEKSKSISTGRFRRLYNAVYTFWFPVLFHFHSNRQGNRGTNKLGVEVNLPNVIKWIMQRVFSLNLENKQYKISCLPYYSFLWKLKLYTKHSSEKRILYYCASGTDLLGNTLAQETQNTPLPSSRVSGVIRLVWCATRVTFYIKREKLYANDWIGVWSIRTVACTKKYQNLSLSIQ